MSVVACPKCAEKVTLPPKAPPTAKVRCPLCGEDYLLEEAMSTMPPMLEVLELPEGYQPESEVDISTEAFLKTPDRPAVMDETDELKLEGSEGGVAVADELTPTYDEWGPTRSTTATYELEESPAVDTAITPRELVQTPVRKRKKQINPIFHVIGIVGGGVVAIPVALLILLWLPGSLRRDPLQIGHQLGQYAPFLVPADFRPTDSDDSQSETTTPAHNIPAVANKKNADTPKRTNGGGLGDGIDVKPQGKTGLTPSEMEAELNKGFSLDSDAPAETKEKPKTKTQPKSDDPLDTEPVIDDTKPELITDLPELDLPETKPEAKSETKEEPEPKPEPGAQPEPESKTESQPEAKQAPAVKVDPQVNFTLPERSQAADPLVAQKLAIKTADSAFEQAATPAEKKGAAIELYRAAAELAEQLPRDTSIPAELDLLTRDAKKLQFVGIYAASWQENIERATPGIVLSGTVKECRQVGERYEARVELPSRQKRELLVITADQCQPGQKLFVAGRFVMNARDMISGYSGDATMAIDARVLKVVE